MLKVSRRDYEDLLKAEEILRKRLIEGARQDFFTYESCLTPSFFIRSRHHLVLIADTLQKLYEGKLLKPNGKPYRKLMLNMPPRHGKSFSLTRFTEWCLGKDQTNRIITVCYNETLSGRFSKGVRNSIEATNIDRNKIVFSDVFPDVSIQQGDGASQLWSLEGQHFNYLGTSFKGTVTGIGCNIGIIDDPIKNKEEAFNDRVLESHYDFYTDTFLSRLEEGAVQIVNMTRWANSDLCGRLLEIEPDDWYVLKLEAYNKDTDEMLCSDLLSKESYEDKRKKTSPEIFNANYHQQPIDAEGRLYKSFKTYDKLPEGVVMNYTDTADTGADYLCSIDYIEHNKQAYIVDVYFTQEGMEVTEIAMAERLERNNVKKAEIESNNGGRGFARNVQRICKENGYNGTAISWFHQSSNKQARIFSQSFWVQENIFFPANWHLMWPEFYKHMTTYLKEGKNKHDDAQDAITGVAERCQRRKAYVV